MQTNVILTNKRRTHAQSTWNSKPGLGVSYAIWPGNRVGLFYTHGPTKGRNVCNSWRSKLFSVDITNHNHNSKSAVQLLDDTRRALEELHNYHTTSNWTTTWWSLKLQLISYVKHSKASRIINTTCQWWLSKNEWHNYWSSTVPCPLSNDLGTRQSLGFQLLEVEAKSELLNVRTACAWMSVYFISRLLYKNLLLKMFCV